MAVALEASGISKRFGKIAALDQVSLTAAMGEAVGLVGPNGSGKTTFLRCSAGLLRMDSGRSSILGHDVGAEHSAAMASLAFVPELPAPYPSLTPREHLLFTARVFALPLDWEARARSILEDLDLADRADRLCGQLSKGQKQKVHLACAMLRDPPLTLLDEPLIGIDPKGVRRLKDWIRARVAAGGAVVLSSHTLGFVEEVCQRVAVIDRGRVLAVGSLADLKTRTRTPGGATLEDVFLRLTEPEVAGPLAR